MSRLFDAIDDGVNRLSKYAVTIDKILSWVVAVFGLFLSLWSMANGDVVSTPWIFCIILADAILLVLFGVFSAVLYARQRMQFERRINEVDEQLINSNAAHSDVVREYDIRIAQVEKDIDQVKEIHDDFLVEQATLTRAAIEGINRISDAANVYFERIERLSSFIDSVDLLSEQDCSDADQVPDRLDSHLPDVYQFCISDGEQSLRFFRNTLFREHNAFLKELLDTGCDMVRSQLLLRGFDLKVAMCVKLFLAPDMEDELLTKTPTRNIFTAFRDSKTFESERRRENPPQLFSVRGNTDFEHCLATDSTYIFNNATKGGAVRNDSSFFCTLYNCGATSQIVSKVKGSRDSGFVYGFVACDVNNPDSSKKPIDESVANILIALRNLLAMYYYQIYSTWNFVYDAEDYDGKEEEEGHGQSTRSFFQAYYDYLNQEIDG